MADPRRLPEDYSSDQHSDVWREVRGGLPAQDVHLPDASPGGQVGPDFHLDGSDHWLGRIAIYYIAHPTIPNLYHCCFDYVEPWDWSRETEHVPTGRWVHLVSPADD
jgi:hypothetical protein